MQKLLNSRGHAGERRRIIHHYLKGTLWCGACYARDKTISRMVIRRTISRAGDEYFYFFCVGTYRGNCNAKYSNMQRVEEAVEEHYRTLSFDPDFLEAMRSLLATTLADQEDAQRLLKQQLDDQLAGLDAKESNLLDLASDGTLPQQKIRLKLREIATERDRLVEQLEHVTDSLADAVRFIEANLALLENPYELYLGASDEVRRRLNQAIFNRLFIEHDDITDHDLHEPFGDLLTTQAVHQARRASQPNRAVHDLAQHSWIKHYKSTEKEAARWGGSFTAMTLEIPPRAAQGVAICNKTQLVGMTGFEPATP